MDKIQSEILTVINDYMKLLKESGFPVERAYLFGSHSNETATDDSDIDLAIASPAFSGQRFVDKRKIKSLRRKADLRLSPYPLTLNDLENDPFAIHEIVNKGIRII